VLCRTWLLESLGFPPASREQEDGEDEEGKPRGPEGRRVSRNQPSGKPEQHGDGKRGTSLAAKCDPGREQRDNQPEAPGNGECPKIACERALREVLDEV
jgi:hypothetical protein